MNINNKLITFAQQELVLAHNDTERDRIKGSVSQLEKILKDRLGKEIKEFVRFGSFTRNTILPRRYDSQSDVDLMVVFNTDTWKKNPRTYRTNLLQVLSAAYPNSISKKDFPAVKLLLNHIMFDVVPAYSETQFWGSGYNYYIPDANDSWRGTVPNEINERLRERNQYYRDNTVRNVIRLCKHWNASRNYPFQSYLMEKSILDVNFANENTYSGFLYALNQIGSHLSGVSQALSYIRQYKGDWFTTANEEKQFEWLQRLLPGLT